MQKTFFISDTHFYHKNIIEYCNRPFKNVEEMNQTLIDNWNKVIKPEYLIFVLGDFALTGKDKTTEILSQLNGEKFLIMGNHDRRKSTKYWKEVGFNEVSKYPICLDDFYWLSHEPMIMCDKSHYINLHGHIHNNKLDSLNHYNVSVENNNNKPTDLNFLNKKFRKEVK